MYQTIRTNPPLREHLSLGNPPHLVVPYQILKLRVISTSCATVHHFELSTSCFIIDIMWSEGTTHAVNEDPVGHGFWYDSVLWLISDNDERGIETKTGLLGLLSIFN
jgi:hypothetical protein